MPTAQDRAFEKAVEQAAIRAAQYVARIHRLRLVTQSFLAALTVALLVVIGGGLYLRATAVRQARHDALANCRLVKGLSGAMADFIETDVRVRERQARAAISVVLVRRLQRLLHVRGFPAAASRANQESFNVARHWRAVDERTLGRLAQTNCATSLP